MIETAALLDVQSTRFGQFRVPTQSIIEFPEGLIGFPKLKRFAVLPHSEGGMFYWFQSLQEAGFAFPVTDPRRFLPDFQVTLDPIALSPFAPSAIAELAVYVMVSIPRECPQELWLNLQGPLMVHEASQTAKQLLLDAARYPLRYRVSIQRNSNASTHAKTASKHPHR